MHDFKFTFDHNNTNWSQLPEYNAMFLKVRQNWLNDKLRANGVLFLNQALEDLGIPIVPEGQLYGWGLTKADYVDFGIFSTSDQSFNEYLFNGKPLTLTFNVSGIVLHKIGA